MSGIDFSVSGILEEKFGIDIPPGRKGECPFCRKKTFSIKIDDSLGTCFHPHCGKRIISGGIYDDRDVYISQVLEEIFNDMHRNLLAEKNLQDQNAYEYLLNQRKIHPRVIADSLLGSVPVNYSIPIKFEGIINEAKVALAEQNGKRASKNIRLMNEDRLIYLSEMHDNLKFCLANKAGWLTFFYTDENHQIVGFRLRKPYSKRFAHFKPSKSVTGVFGLNLFMRRQTKSMEYMGDNLIVVEGEMNLLQLQSLCLRIGEAKNGDCGYLFACAAGGVNNADFKTISKLPQHPIIVYDNDKSGSGFKLVESAIRTMSVEAVTTPKIDSDLDSFIRSFGDNNFEAWKQWKILLATKKSYFRNYRELADEIFQIRRKQIPGGSLKSFEVNSEVGAVVLNDMRERGKFYNDGQFAYYFSNDTKRLMPISTRGIEFKILFDDYGINGSEPILKYIIEKLGTFAFKHGLKTKIHSFSYFDCEKCTLFLYYQKGSLIRITPNSIDICDNGADGIIFLSNYESHSFEFIDKEDQHSWLWASLLSDVNFSNDLLTRSERILIFTLWFYSLFFKEVQQTRPILTLLGVKGSGKTFILQKVGCLLFGKDFKVTSLPSNVKDLDILITQKDFIVLDNADSAPKWLNDKLAIIATGGAIMPRKLYSDNQSLSYSIDAFVAITSRTPKFKREDIAERLLILKVDRINSFQPASDLLNSMLNNRDKIMSEVVRHLQEILESFRDYKVSKFHTQFRIADFANFVLKVASANGIEERVKLILAKLTREQSVFTLDSEPLFDLLSRWAMQNSSREVTSAELSEELNQLAKELNVEMNYQITPKQLGHKIKHLRSNLDEFFNINVRIVGSRKKLYSFKPKIKS